VKTLRESLTERALDETTAQDFKSNLMFLSQIFFLLPEIA
jgi:hypothetical protein